MALRIEVKDVVAENFDQIPAADPRWDCRACFFWQEGGVKGIEEKRAWFQEAENKYGPCGSILYFEGEPVGYCQYGPMALFPTLSLGPNPKEKVWPQGYQIPSSPDAYFLTCIHVLASYRGKGLARSFLQSVVAGLKKRGAASVDSFAAREGHSSERTVGPLALFEECSFQIVADDPGFPVVRMNLKSGPPGAFLNPLP